MDRRKIRTDLAVEEQERLTEEAERIKGVILEEDEELYREVSAEVEPAIKLSWEIEQENRKLRHSNDELQSNNKELRRELENACKRMINEAEREGKSAEEIVNMIMRVFSLTKREAEEKVKTLINILP